VYLEKKIKKYCKCHLCPGIISSAENVILIDALHSLLFHLKNTAHIIFVDAMFNLMTFFRKKSTKKSHPVIMISGKSKSKTKQFDSSREMHIQALHWVRCPKQK
jgi:hypothetical protein